MLNRKERKKEELKELNRIFECQCQNCIDNGQSFINSCKEYLEKRKEFPSEYTNIKSLKEDLKRLRSIEIGMLKMSVAFVFSMPGLSDGQNDN